MATDKACLATMNADNFEQRVGELLNESAEAGDAVMVLACERVLGAGEGGTSATPAERRDARWICATALVDAEANAYVTSRSR